MPNRILHCTSRKIRPLLYGLFDINYWDRKKNIFPRLGWYINPLSVSRRFVMRRMKNDHMGERCFIIGNGPSLSHMDLSHLRQEQTFGMNRIYLLFPRLGFSTSYFVSVNRLVIQQCGYDINSLSIPKFISWHAREFISCDKNVFYVRDPYDGSVFFGRNPVWKIWEGATVTFVAMQIAYFMGFSQVVLIGVDHSFCTPGEPHQVVKSSGDDPNHFDPKYFSNGFRWQLPDLETSTFAYRLAKEQFEKDGREILDATVDGKLDVFRKVEFNSLF